MLGNIFLALDFVRIILFLIKEMNCTIIIETTQYVYRNVGINLSWSIYQLKYS